MRPEMSAEMRPALRPDNDSEIRQQLLIEHAKLLKRIQNWRSETMIYRWLNILLFMSCKIVVPVGALIVAIDMISIVMKKNMFSDVTTAVIATTVTVLASLEAMLNPGSKKRLAFTLNNELSSLESKLNLAKISATNNELAGKIVSAEDELKRLLNHYSENGY
jgi:hypothetical protein